MAGVKGTHLRPDSVNETWPKQCGGCKRITWPRSRMVNKPMPRPDWAKERGDVVAALTDGTCARCYEPTTRQDKSPVFTVAADGRPLPPKPFKPRATLPKRRKFTQEQIDKCRADLQLMFAERRARGIPEEGQPVEDWAAGNGGLYHFEVP